MNFVSHRTQQLVKDLELSEARYKEIEELLSLLGKALDLVPVRDLKSGSRWLPSDEALELLTRAKNRLTEWRVKDQ